MPSDKGKKKILVFRLKFLKLAIVWRTQQRGSKKEIKIKEKRMRKKRRRRRRCIKHSKDEKAFIINFYRSPNRNGEETTHKRTKNNSNDTISYLPAKYEN